MSRIFGFAVGAVWIVFTFMALRSASAGAAAGQPDAQFWYTIVAVLLGIAATGASVGTLRHTPSGPRK
jgi:mannose/fructose/N-acetylgalactosamine-specific phosphotransferase system component IID